MVFFIFYFTGNYINTYTSGLTVSIIIFINILFYLHSNRFSVVPLYSDHDVIKRFGFVRKKCTSNSAFSIRFIARYAIRRNIIYLLFYSCGKTTIKNFFLQNENRSATIILPTKSKLTWRKERTINFTQYISTYLKI